MAWTYVLLASGFEILFALGLKYTEGFTRLGWSMLTVALELPVFSSCRRRSRPCRLAPATRCGPGLVP